MGLQSKATFRIELAQVKAWAIPPLIQGAEKGRPRQCCVLEAACLWIVRMKKECWDQVEEDEEKLMWPWTLVWKWKYPSLPTPLRPTPVANDEYKMGSLDSLLRLCGENPRSRGGEWLNPSSYQTWKRLNHLLRRAASHPKLYKEIKEHSLMWDIVWGGMHTNINMGIKSWPFTSTLLPSHTPLLASRVPALGFKRYMYMLL